jgi:predicted O-methyltransferase YrrM
MSQDGQIFAVDPFLPGRLGFSAHRRIAIKEVSKSSNGIVRWVRMTGEAAATWYRANSQPPVDFVFIDADHTWEGLRADWTGWSPLVRVGGVIALHDSRSSPTRVIDDAGSLQYTSAVISKDARFVRIDEVDSVSVFRRTVVLEPS